MKTDTKKKTKGGFTLIELLIVIGLLGALTALILPRLAADRQEAMEDVCAYNKAGTVRTLYQYEEVTGGYPADMHSGLIAYDSGSTSNRMLGMPTGMAFNISDGAGSPAAKPASIVALTSNEVASLAAAGITSLCYDTGLNSRPLAAGDYVIMSCNGHLATPEQWLHKDFTPSVAGSGDPAKGRITFDGRTLINWITDMTPAGGGNPGVIVACFIAPTVDWSKGSGDNSDWTKGEVEVGISLPGQAPCPTEDAEGGHDISFGYHSAHFLVDNDGSDGIQPAKLLGVMCGQPLNP